MANPLVSICNTYSIHNPHPFKLFKLSLSVFPAFFLSPLLHLSLSWELTHVMLNEMAMSSGLSTNVVIS